MNKRIFFRICICSIFFLLTSTILFADDQKYGRFRRAFINVDSTGALTPVKREDVGEIMKDGEFMMFFRPLRDSYLYFLLFGPGGRVEVLFPATFDLFEVNYETFEHWIPGEMSWESLVKLKGEYEIHIIVAEKRLIGLEALILLYNRVKEKKDSALERLKTRVDILAEIRRLKRSFRLIAARPKRDFVDEAGTRRSGKRLLIEEAESISFKKLFSEVYFIKNE